MAVLKRKDDTAKVAASVAAEAPVAEEVSSKLESKCGTVAFVAPLGDPSRPDITITKAKDGTENSSTTPTIVGYRFKALEDMDVPECGFANKEDPMSFVDPTGKKHVKAGETFDLTRFETGLLLSPEEFNGKATGGEIPVTVAYITKKAPVKGGLQSVEGRIPTITLRAAQGSLKDIQSIPVLKFEATKAENGSIKKTREILPGFEKWEALCKVAVRKTSPRAAAPKTKQRNKGAADFLKMVAAKAKKA